METLELESIIEMKNSLEESTNLEELVKWKSD